MKRLRELVTVVCFVALTSVAVVAALRAASIGLPESLTSNATVLIGALASEELTADLNRRDAATDRNTRQTIDRLAKRVQRELQANVDWEAELAPLDRAQRKRLQENVLLLAIDSFKMRQDRFFEITDTRRRQQFLDRQVDTMLTWATIVNQIIQGPSDAVAGQIALPNLLSRINQEFRGASPEELERMRQFQRAIQDRLLERMKRRMMFNGP